MDKFYRVLDGDDVIVALGIDFVDHRGKCRRLARARRTGDKNQATRLLA